MEDFQDTREDDGVDDVEVMTPSKLCPVGCSGVGASQRPFLQYRTMGCHHHHAVSCTALMSGLDSARSSQNLPRKKGNELALWSKKRDSAQLMTVD